MGYNTVAVIYNDMTSEIKNHMPRLDEAMRSFGHNDLLDGYFGVGKIISQAHADYPQITVIGRNSGEVVHHDNEVSDWALDALVNILEMRGFKVKRPTTHPTHDGE